MRENFPYIQTYESYLGKFNKSISRIDAFDRLNVFSKSFDFVQSFNEEQNIYHHHAFSLDLNNFSDLKQEEINLHFSENIDLENRNTTTVSSQSNQFYELPPFHFSPVFVNTHNRRSLNWATNDNSLSISIVSAVQNQGSCGACWAFVAVDSVEANIKLVTGTQTELSVQELIDCDTKLNKGCSGGNQIFAFEYIMKNGITNSCEYAYFGQKGVCQNEIESMRSYINGYLRIIPRDSSSLIAFLSYGPIATGICGMHPSFMYYSRGIYTDRSCCDDQNHAILLVGYGHDNVLGLNYWVLKNSWGEFWGESGFIRLLRTNDSSLGLCGFDLFPSMPFGGYVIGAPPLDAARDKEASSNNISHVPDTAHSGHHSVVDDIVKPLAIILSFNHWELFIVYASLALMLLSIAMMAYSCYFDLLMRRINTRKQYQPLSSIRFNSDS